MTLRRRLVLVFSVALVATVTFTSASIATAARLSASPPAAQGNGGGGFLPAGNYHFTSMSADFFIFSTSPLPQLTVFVNSSTQQSDPLVGESTFTSETDVSFGIIDGTNFWFGCFVLTSPTDFTVSNLLQSAALHTTFTDASPACPGFFNTVPLPVTLDVTWTGAKAIATSRDDRRFNCLTYSSETLTTNRSNNATATASVSPLFASPFTADQAGFSSNDQREHVEGTIQQACEFFGIGGKGAGPSAPPAGNYENTSSMAGLFGSDSRGDSINVFANAITNVSMQLGGASTNTVETDVEVFVSGPVINGSGCYVLATPPDFAITGVQSASLHTVITDATPACQNSSNNIPLPLTVDATWTSQGPVAATSDVSRFACLNYSTETNSARSSIQATATISLTPLITDPIAVSGAGLDTSSQRTHAQGVDQDVCINRG